MNPVSYCGLYCGACDSYQVTKEKKTREAATAWEMKEEDLKCQGCKTDVVSIYCRKCPVKACAKEHQVESCIECWEYPCAKLLKFKTDHPHHEIVLMNLERIKKVGTDQWLEEQKIRWSCFKCGKEYTWFDETCSVCGSLIKSCIEENKSAINL